MVRLSTTFLLLGTAIASRQPAAQLSARGLMTCEQTYGSGWTQCGQAGSGFCYNPTAGQTCCADDSGYCEADEVCAPVAGICCAKGEDMASCMANSDFDPPSASLLPTGVGSGSGTLTVTATTTVNSFSLKPSSSSSTTHPLITAASNASSGATNSSSGPAATGKPPVQVSLAMKEQWTLVWMSLAMGVVGVFMAMC